MCMCLLILFHEDLLGEGPELKYHHAIGKRNAKIVVLLGYQSLEAYRNKVKLLTGMALLKTCLGMEGTRWVSNVIISNIFIPDVAL